MRFQKFSRMKMLKVLRMTGLVVRKRKTTKRRVMMRGLS